MIARFEPVGQVEMNPAARPKIERIPRGVSKAEGTAADLEATRMNVWWRDSTVTIEAATERMEGVLRRGAAPRYLFIPHTLACGWKGGWERDVR